MSDVKLLKHNASNVNNPDDPSYPFKFELRCSAPEFMEVAFVMLHGSEEVVVVAGKTQKALEKLIAKEGYDKHPRLRSLKLIGPDGLIWEKKR